MADVDSYKNMERVKIVQPNGVIIDGYVADIDKNKKRLYIRAFGYGLMIANAADEPKIIKKKEREKNEVKHSKRKLRKTFGRSKSRT